MPHDLSREFFALYHAAVFESLGEDAPKYNARIGAILANSWLKRLKEHPSGDEGFKEALEAYFRESFSFADLAEMTFSSGGEASIHIKGCDICHGNEILRNSGKKGSCPISQLIKSAMGKTLKRNVELTGSEKPGSIGECYLKYRIKE